MWSLHFPAIFVCRWAVFTTSKSWSGQDSESITSLTDILVDGEYMSSTEAQPWSTYWGNTRGHKTPNKRWRHATQWHQCESIQWRVTKDRRFFAGQPIDTAEGVFREKDIEDPVMKSIKYPAGRGWFCYLNLDLEKHILKKEIYLIWKHCRNNTHLLMKTTQDTSFHTQTSILHLSGIHLCNHVIRTTVF